MFLRGPTYHPRYACNLHLQKNVYYYTVFLTMAFIFYFSEVEEFDRVIAKRMRKEATFAYQKVIILPYAFTLHFTFIHLADAFIQSDL